MFPFAGGDDPKVQGSGIMTISYDEHGQIMYTLDYSLPALALGFTWAGFAMRFDQPIDSAKFDFIELAVRFSDPGDQCELKPADNSNNFATFALGGPLAPGSGVTVTTEGDSQLVKIPLRGIFDSVNLEQIKEIVFTAPL